MIKLFFLSNLLNRFNISHSFETMNKGEKKTISEIIRSRHWDIIIFYDYRSYSVYFKSLFKAEM